MVRVEERFRKDGTGSSGLVTQEVFIAGEFLVVPRDDAPPAEVENALQASGAESWEKIYGGREFLVRFAHPDLDTKQRVLDEFAKHARVIELAEGNGICFGTAIPNDPLFRVQDSLHNTRAPSSAPRDIRAVAAWDIASSSPDVVVAVVDSGLDFTHPDLVANVYLDATELAANGIDDDGNGRIDDYRGWDFVQNDNNPADDNDHGTHVAGIIGAAGNDAYGISGVTWSSRILPVKVLGASNSGSHSDVIAGINYARGKGAKVINMSLGGPTNSSSMANAIQLAMDAGILIVTSAGNDAINIDSSPKYPASHPHENIITVMNTTDLDRLYPESNYGVTACDLSAPGESIYSTVRGGAYDVITGTSMSAPHVSGVACLMASLKPDISVADIRRYLLENVDLLPDLNGKCVTGGRLNAEKALLALISEHGAAPAFTMPPEEAHSLAGETARFSVGVSGHPAPRLRWQISTDSGTTWVDLNDFGIFSGTKTGTLTIRSVDGTLDGHLFRAVAENRVGAEVAGTAAELTVDASPARAIAPVPTPNGGKHSSGPLQVTVSSPTEGATFRYTLDGSEPSENSTEYSGSIEIAADATLKVRAFVSGLEPSTVSTSVFKVGGATATPIRIWGSNVYSQRTVPGAVGDAVAVSCGDGFCVALRRNGTVAAWGKTTSGVSTVPAGLSGVIAIASGSNHTLALKSDGTVTAWGQSTSGQTTVPAGLTNVVAIAAAVSQSLALKSDGKVVAWGSTTQPPIGLEEVVGIATGNNFSVALKQDGTVSAWGNSSNGVLTVPAGLTDVVSVAAGNSHVLALKRDGTVVGWGDNSSGQRSIPAAAKGIVAIAAGNSHSIAIKGDRTIIAWGYNAYNEGEIPKYPINADAIYAGTSNVMALVATDPPAFDFQAMPVTVATGQRANLVARVTSATHWQWYEGNTGDTTRPVPGAVWPWLVTPPLTEGQTYWLQAWNSMASSSSQPAVVSVMPGADMPTISPPPGAYVTGQLITLGSATAGAEIRYTLDGSLPGAASPLYSAPFALNANATVRARAFRNDLLTSRAATSDYVIQAPATITVQPQDMHGVTGDSTTLSVTSTGAQLSYQWYQGESGDTSQPVSGATTTTLALLLPAEGTSRYWLRVSNAASFANSRAPILSSEPSPIRVMPLRPGTLPNASGLVDVISVCCGSGHILAITAEGKVIAWGNNTYGECTVPADLTNVVQVAAGEDHSVALKADGTVVSWGRNNLGQRGMPANLGSVVAISAGRTYTLVLRQNGGMLAWGRNEGLISNPPTGTNFRAIASGGHHHFALKADSTLSAWGGQNNSGQRTIPAGLTSVVGMTAGDHHSIAVLADGGVRAWGNNNNNMTVIPTEPLNAVAVAAAGDASLALTTNGNVLIWSSIAFSYNLPGPGNPACSISAANTNVLALITHVPPQIVSLPPSSTITPGEVRVLRIVAMGAAQHQWYEGQSGDTSAPVALADRPWLQTPALAGTTRYWVRLTNALGHTDSPAITLATSPHAAWLTEHFTSAQQADPMVSGADADPDKDGLVNLLEYAFALDPWSGDLESLPRATLAPDGSKLQLNFNRREDLHYEIQVSRDLDEWIDSDPALFVTEQGATTNVELRVSIGSQCYMRIAVSYADP
ncbi:S8 family serine peptidase [Luteolibacter arcticus]|uniref:S8 family serine peptidase n=1 Tax=Luteolibacter arcticus TaxID=1581411 RepID=A0ABT3GSN0_9BACT|nr:S8 family serine peptidase [Luteolibacter arcticus]MCW1926478.1 S8 family serine peptidase [Luteolibacter arcticus]